MKHSSMAISVLLLSGLSTVLILSGIKMRPGIGILAAIITIPIVMWIRGTAPGEIGLGFPVNGISVILQGLTYGILISVIIFGLN